MYWKQHFCRRNLSFRFTNGIALETLPRGGVQIKIIKLVQVLMDYDRHHHYSFPFNEA